MNAGSAALIAALQPALTAIVSPFLLGEMNDRLRWCGIGLGSSGLLVFVAGDMQLSGTPLWVYGLPLLATICLTPLALWFEGFASEWGGQLVFATIWLAIPVSVGAYGLMFHLIRTRETTRISALQYFVPPVTMVIAWAVFGEAFAGLGLLGLLITNFGFYLMSLSERRVSQRQPIWPVESTNPEKC